MHQWYERSLFDKILVTLSRNQYVLIKINRTKKVVLFTGTISATYLSKFLGRKSRTNVQEYSRNEVYNLEGFFGFCIGQIESTILSKVASLYMRKCAIEDSFYTSYLMNGIILPQHLAHAS